MSEDKVCKNGNEDSRVLKGNYKVVVYDFETTGKSLQDEICHIGCLAPHSGEDQDNPKDQQGEEDKQVAKNSEFQYSQYIMPYRDVSFSARNAYGLAVVTVEYQRMLRDINTGVLLKTKSEIFALKDWMKWLEEVKGESEGIILVHHAYEQVRDLQVPQLLLSLNRYNLFPQFTNLVKGFCNSVNVISDLGDKSIITSLSLRSLCKTVLKNPSLSTNSAKDRCARILDILVDVTSNGDLAKHVCDHAKNPTSELANLRRLEALQNAQYSMRPIFLEAFSEGYKTRTRMLEIRRNIAEHGLDYVKLTELYKQDKLEIELKNVKLEDNENHTVMMDTVINHFKMLSHEEKVKSSDGVNLDD